MWTMKVKQFKVRVSTTEHRLWTSYAKKLYDDSRKVSLMIRMAVNGAIDADKKR